MEFHITVIEALLVPETLGLKAEIVTIRSVAVHVALDQGFFDPNGILLAYDLRSDLIHGAPTSDVIATEALEMAQDRRYWAFRFLRDYLNLAMATQATTVKDLVPKLDGDACLKVWEWLDDRGGARVVVVHHSCTTTAPLVVVAVGMDARRVYRGPTPAHHGPPCGGSDGGHGIRLVPEPPSLWSSAVTPCPERIVSCALLVPVVPCH
ncbi:MAG: hypothetical protein ACP5P1_09240 [Acidimicrobiales bacterium]